MCPPINVVGGSVDEGDTRHSKSKGPAFHSWLTLTGWGLWAAIDLADFISLSVQPGTYYAGVLVRARDNMWGGRVGVPGTVLQCSIPGRHHYRSTPLVRAGKTACVCVTRGWEETFWDRAVASRA